MRKKEPPSGTALPLYPLVPSSSTPCLPRGHPSYHSFCLSQFSPLPGGKSKAGMTEPAASAVGVLSHRCPRGYLISVSHLSLPICHLQVLRPELQLWERGCSGATQLRLARSLPRCRGQHFWQPGNAGELVDVKRVRSSHALNSTWFPEGGCWQVGQSPGGSCGCPQPPLQTEEPGGKTLRVWCLIARG